MNYNNIKSIPLARGVILLVAKEYVMLILPNLLMSPFAPGDVIECFVNDAYCFTMHGYDSSGSGLSIKTLAENTTIQGYEIGVAGKCWKYTLPVLSKE